ncbi:LytR/AlgR family response regulator transcription factor [Companilactobacillus jidongensis]|uniref:LytR/AlgR family response regulator transcription factor n=1 Tax=Companilactobacillus jidongensis TaxID=2486006 RepID=UPI000F76C00F|nr:response regulator transcription factor [Companilactobacillus jidongensis]
MSYPIIICEDNFVQLQRMGSIIDNYIQFHNEFFNVVLKSDNPNEITEYLEKYSIQNGIYFLDIDLHKSINGIDLAEKIRTIDVLAKIVFVTTHDEMAPQTFQRKVEAIGFVAKDQDPDDFRKEIQDILALSQKRIDEVKVIKNQDDIVSFHYDNMAYNVESSEILFIEPSPINSHKLELYTKSGKFEFYGKLKEFENKYSFLVRANRSCLVNPKSIKQVDFNTREMVFDEGLSRYVTPLKKKKLKDIMTN